MESDILLRKSIEVPWLLWVTKSLVWSTQWKMYRASRPKKVILPAIECKLLLAYNGKRRQGVCEKKML